MSVDETSLKIFDLMREKIDDKSAWTISDFEEALAMSDNTIRDRVNRILSKEGLVGMNREHKKYMHAFLRNSFSEIPNL